MLTSDIRRIPLLNLRDGADHPAGNFNMRKGGDDADLGPLRASLRADGQFQIMVGTTIGDGDEVYLVIGNRRRRAALANFDEDRNLSLNQMDVRVYPDLTLEQAMQIALAEKLTELPMHEVDQYEAFAAMGDLPVADIAAHFACSERLVRQRQKLGKLSENVRAAWRQGELDRKTAEAFTLAPDAKTQNKVLNALKRSHSLTPRAVRVALLPDQDDVPRLLTFASEIYVGKGGGVITDLFEEEHGATDPALLKQCAEDKLNALGQDFIVKHGFAWAALESDLPQEWHGWPRLKITPVEPSRGKAGMIQDLNAVFARTDATEAEYRFARIEIQRIEDDLALEGIAEKKRAKTGVVLSIDRDGGLHLVLGVERPEAPAARVLNDQTSSDAPLPKNGAVTANRAADPEDAPRLSHKSQSQRAVELTDAAAQVLAKHPALALVVLLAGFADRGGYGAIRAQLGGASADTLRLMEGDDIAENINRLAKMKPAVQQQLLAKAAAASLIFQAHSADRPAISDAGTAAILKLLPPKELQAALVRRFDPDDYFGKALPKELALVAIRENCGQGVLEDQREGSATDIRAFALANLKDDWLPPEHRGAWYSGPGAKKTPAAKPAAKAAKPKAKKKA